MDIISIANFKKYQHYKDRNPLWIKVYTKLLDNYRFARLQDASKLLLIFLWLLAARYANKIPCDPEWIQRVTGLKDSIDLEPLEKAGFIIKSTACNGLQDASNMLASREQHATLERETEREVEREEARVSAPTPKAEKAQEKKPSKKGKKEGASLRGHRLPETWAPCPEDYAAAVKRLGEAHAHDATNGFRDHWHSTTGSAAAKLNWDMAYRNWIRRERPRHDRPNVAAAAAAFADSLDGGEGGYIPTHRRVN